MTGDVGAMIERNQEEARILERLKAATIALRDTGLAHQKAQAEYREALQAFNRWVAPECDAG